MTIQRINGSGGIEDMVRTAQMQEIAKAQELQFRRVLHLNTAAAIYANLVGDEAKRKMAEQIEPGSFGVNTDLLYNVAMGAANRFMICAGLMEVRERAEGMVAE